MSASRNLSRPNLGSMTATIKATQVNGNITFGNTELDATKADAIDLGFEWYFAEEAVLSFTYFYKGIERFIINNTTQSGLSPELKNNYCCLPVD